MAVNVKNAFIATPPIDGGVYFRAPLNTELPEDTDSALHADFEDHGAVGEDGFSVAQSRTSTDIKMMGGGTYIDAQTEYTEQLTLTLLEDDNDAVLRTAFGDANVEKTEATAQDGTKRTIYHTDAPLPISSHVVRAVSDDKKKLYAIERGRVSEVAEVQESHSDVTKRQLTIKCFKSTKPEYKGAYVVELRNDGEPSSVTGGGNGGAEGND